MTINPETFCREQVGTDVNVKGYRILLKAVVLPEKTKAGIILTEAHKKFERRSYNIGQVLKLGLNAYKPLEKFGAPYCQVGDWVYFSSYERDEAYINDHLCYFINDERIYAVIPDISAVVNELR